MSTALLDHTQIEALAIDMFAKVRGDGLTLGEGVDLRILSGEAAVDTYAVRLRIQLIVFDGDSIRDIKDQDVGFVLGGADEARLAAYFEGVARGIRARAEAGTNFESATPHEIFAQWTLMDPTKKTVSDFAAAVLEAAPAKDAAEIDDLSGTEPIARNRSFEEAIAADPEKIENYVVYADWLTERGDPRGELIACSLPGASSVARRRATDVLIQNERYFAGNLLSDETYGTRVQLEWTFGWISAARLDSSYSHFAEDRHFVAKALRALLALHSSALIGNLILGCFNFESDNDYTSLYPILVAGGARPSLRKLFIGDTDVEEQELSWTSAGDLRAIGGLYPNLRELKIRAGSMSLEGALDYPKLEELILESGGLSAESVRAVARAPFPALRRLEIWTGNGNYGATSTLEDVAPILEGASLPSLDVLALRNCEYTDAICRALATAPILDRLTSLDFSMGTMTDDGVASLLAIRERFARVQRLDVSDNYLTDAGIAALATLGPHVEIHAGEQRVSDDGERYVSVGE